MLHVCTVRDPSGAYYLGQERAAVEGARWFGRGAWGLNLAGPVSPAALARTLRGEPPNGGRLTAPHAVRAYDLVFTAPKSVSLAWGLGGVAVEEAVRVSHAEAWAAAAGYLAERAVAVRRASGADRRLVPVEGIVAAAFTHRESRAGDPHLHTHLVVANLARGTDGRWSALDGRGLYAHARAAGALYGSQLRRALTDRLGVEWVRTVAGRPEIAGVDPVAIGGFSSRSAEIRAELAVRGSRSNTARRVAWASTRDVDPTVPVRAGDRGERWRRRAARLGVAAVVVAGGPSRIAVPAAVEEHRLAAALHRAGDAPRRRHLVAAWADAVLPGATVASVLDCIDRIDPRHGLGVAEPVLEGRTVPAPHLLRALGPRPADPGRLDVWYRGATAVDRYRTRWGVTAAEPLGLEDDLRLVTLPAARLASHLETARCVEEVRRLLGRPAGREPPGPERGLGIGLG